MKKFIAVVAALTVAGIIPTRAADAPRVVSIKPDRPAENNFVVHEWGTFTSVQGGDGKLLPWRGAQVGDLPRFVHRLGEPDLNRQMPMGMLLLKDGPTTLQRMETPVIYFYSDRELTADVTVRFPKGTVTDWFPQAMLLGPSTPSATNGTRAHVTTNSLIQWSNVRVLPQIGRSDYAAKLPGDTNGSHYFAARETQAAFVRANNYAPTNATDEFEKYLFYRGSGDFSTPLTVTVNDSGTFTLTNSGTAPLTGVLLLRVENGIGEWQRLGDLRSSTSSSLDYPNLGLESGRLPLAELKKSIGETMARALTDTGLYPDEAKAMVKTWSDSWFTEAGVRVLYIVPRQWTDEILPLTLNPKPRELVRTMVGRSEIIMPAAQKEIATYLKRSNAGDQKAKEWLSDYSKKFGRFASPAFQLGYQTLKELENKPVANAAATAYTP